MKAFVRKIASVKKRQIAKKAIGLVAAAWAFKYGHINSDPAPTSADSGQYTEHLNEQYLYQKTDTINNNDRSLTESNSINSSRFKIVTGSGAI